MSSHLDSLTQARHHHRIFEAGVEPFITFRSFQLAAGRRIIWKAREQRKGLQRFSRALENLPVRLWETRGYNQVMGATFALGSALFILGALMGMLPQAGPSLLAWANVICFLGSIPFTLAAYMQHFQAANAGDFSTDPGAQRSRRGIRLLGWKPKVAGWISTATQFAGTLAFNLSTWSAVTITNPWYLEDLLVWGPDMGGSVLFLASAYLAFVEANHSVWRWRPADLDWQIVFVNLLGCIAFMVAACTAYIPRQGPSLGMTLFSNAQLFLGAVCFLIGALLSIRESQAAETLRQPGT